MSQGLSRIITLKSRFNPIGISPDRNTVRVASNVLILGNLLLADAWIRK
jgi:hypothetical protein